VFNISWLKGLRLLLGAAGLALILAGCGKSTTEKLNEAIDGSVQAAVLYNQQNYSKALSEIQKVIANNTDLKRDSALGENYLLLAHCHRMLGSYDSSLSAFKSASEYFHLFGDQRLERRGRIGLAELSYDLQRYTDALTLATSASAEGKVFSDSANSFQASLLVAKIYHKLRNYTKEIATLREILNDPFLQRGGGSKEDLRRMQFEAVRGTGNIDSIQAFFDLWRMSYAGADSGLNAAAYVAWGRYQESMGHPDIAVRVYSRALNLVGGRTQRRLQAEVLTSLGSLSYRAKRYDNARLYYSDALALSKQESNIILEQSMNLMLVACDWKIAGSKPTPQMSKEFEKKCSDVALACAQTAFLKGEAFAHFVRGRIAERRSDSTAVGAFKEALGLSATHLMRSDDDPTVTDALQRVVLDVERIGMYDPILRILGSGSNGEELFAYAEERNLRDIEDFFSRLTLAPSDTNVGDAIGTASRNRIG
jgi:tetratricopeptide (TPR) repeat protein